MKIHEYQGKELLKRRGIPVPAGAVAATPDEAANAADKLGGKRWVVKAQIHAGGRYKGHFEDDPRGEGGVRFAATVEELRRKAAQMIGHVLHTNQTGPVGREVRRVYVETALDVGRELYLAMLVDRNTSKVTLLASREGGVKIETAAMMSPESVMKYPIDLDRGIAVDDAKQVARDLGLADETTEAAARIIMTMYDMFIELDASLIEISPLAVTSNGELIALDATVTFDDNALFRHPDILTLRDEDELRLGELKAVEHGLNYVRLNGNIGLLASGAGLALATLDVVKVYGGEPANFLDVPPAAEVERVRRALRLILSDPNVESVLINVFGGGIMRCDTIADALILAHREEPLRVPVVARLAGTNSDFALRRLKDVGIPVQIATDMASAAQSAIAAARNTRIDIRRSWWQRAQELMSKRVE